jgi:hypothetical protein
MSSTEIGFYFQDPRGRIRRITRTSVGALLLHLPTGVVFDKVVCEVRMKHVYLRCVPLRTRYEYRVPGTPPPSMEKTSMVLVADREYGSTLVEWRVVYSAYELPSFTSL